MSEKSVPHPYRFSVSWLEERDGVEYVFGKQWNFASTQEATAAQAAAYQDLWWLPAEGFAPIVSGISGMPDHVEPVRPPADAVAALRAGLGELDVNLSRHDHFRGLCPVCGPCPPPRHGKKPPGHGPEGCDQCFTLAAPPALPPVVAEEVPW